MRVSRRALTIGLVLVVLAGAAVFAGMRLLGPETVLYQDATSPGPDPFTDPVVLVAAVQPTPTPTTTAEPDSTTTSTAPPPNGPQGPFGGSGNQGECDPEQLILFLNANEERKQAWVDVIGIQIEDFEDYVRSLRPVVLTRDARITNHGFREGEAYEFQAILAAGTAVLVDENGEIVVRCYCGNPLQPPTNIEYECDGCPPNYEPPPPCDGTCYPPLTTTTTMPPTTTTEVEQTTTTTRRPPTTTTRPTTTTTTQPTTTTTEPTTTSSSTTTSSDPIPQ